MSGYLLISLAFVFGAMAEFALVLLVKRNVEQENVKTIKPYDERSSKIDVLYRKKEMATQAGKTPLGRTQGDGVGETKEGEIPTTFFWKRRIRQFHSVYMTTRIDIGAFVFFCCSYVIFNVIYCISMV